MYIYILILVFIASIIFHFFQISRRLKTPHPSVHTTPRPKTKEELLSISDYANIEKKIVAGLPPKSDENYTVVGGSGFLGSWIVNFLLQRGETNIHIIDIAPPKIAKFTCYTRAMIDAVQFSQVDISEQDQIDKAMSTVFNRNGRCASVVFHSAAVIRYFDRCSFNYDICHRINVQGTENVIAACKKYKVKRFIYTGSASSGVQKPFFARWWSPHYNCHPIVSTTAPSGPILSDNYAKSKLLSELIVLNANDGDKFQTVVIRPGMGILGPSDSVLAVYLHLPPPNFTFCDKFAHSYVNVQDVAACLLLVDSKLSSATPHVAKNIFLITGDHDNGYTTFDDMRRSFQMLVNKDFGFRPVEDIFIYLLSHVVELITLIRYYGCRLFGFRPSLSAAFLGNLEKLQPSVFDLVCSDIIIDGMWIVGDELML